MEYNLECIYDSRKDFYGKARVKEVDNILYLTSYETIVASYDKTTHKAVINGWFSVTTARYINEFLRQNGCKPMTKKEMKNDSY